MSMNTILPSLMFILISFIISGLAGLVTKRNIKTWYGDIKKPSFNPPSWIFGPVWTVLYIMIGIAGGLLWELKSQHSALMVLFMIQLMLNFDDLNFVKPSIHGCFVEKTNIELWKWEN